MAMASSTRSISCTYDVFLSFRGPDTRKSFTGHLYAALTGAGIRTFLDDKELETGKRISAELPTAIEHSSMSIVVLSKNYAHSRWCLDELLQIVECMDTRKQLVIPIFYDVEPWEVRHQGGSFAEAFDRHSSRWDTQKLETWKSALARVADLKGWDVAKIANGCEATVISQVVKKVYCVLKTKTCLSGPIKLVGMSSRIAEIKSRWDDRSTTGPYFIGFYGMGGVGKTTTANAFYDLICSDSFEGQYVLENIGEHSRRGSGSLLQLQERFLSNILHIENLKLDSLSMGTALMSEKISSKKVLIIFDDIDKPDQVCALVGERSWFGPGSTVLITTRDKGLLQRIPVDVEYSIKLMEASKSEELFSRHAFEGNSVPETHKKLLHDIVHYCGGLPLALQVLGSHLFNKPLKEWKRTLDKVRLVPMFEIQDKLRISYDGLDVDEKTIFLDIACLFIGEVRDETITILNACNLHAAIGISSLIQKCLLTVKGMSVVRLDMHDLLRDMGRHIVREESQRIGERSRLWLEEETLDVLKYNKGTGSVQCISHASYYHYEEETFRTEAFERMQYLRLLSLKNVNLNGGFGCIFTALKWLRWQGCPLNCLPSTFEPPNLVVLDLRDSSKLITVWEDILYLPSLKKLDLSRCTQLRRTPNLTGTKNLKQLLLGGCSGLEEIHPSIEQLSRLVKLVLDDCRRIEIIPAILSQLIKYTSLNCSEFFFIESLPALPPNLISLDLYLCMNLESLPAQLPPTLEYINVRCCLSLKKLPNLGHLLRMTKLILWRCSALTDIQGLGSLPYIETLNFAYCTSLQSLTVLPPNLKTLILHDCKSLKSLPTLLPPTLEDINARNCTSLENLPNLGHLKRMTSLILTNCSNINEVHGLGNLLDVESLNFSGCTNLESLAVLPQNLKRLRVDGCKRLRLLPEILPTNLDCIQASGCVTLEKVQNLKHLQSMMESIFRNCGKFDDILSVDNLFALRLMNYQGHINWPRADHTLQSLIVPPFSEYRPEITLVMPKVEIPDWFICGKNEDPIHIDMPHTSIQRFIGFMICFNCTSSFPSYNIVIDNQTCSSIYTHKFDNGSHTITDEVISVVIQVQKQISMQGGDIIKIYGSPASGITNIGVYLVYKPSDGN